MRARLATCLRTNRDGNSTAAAVCLVTFGGGGCDLYLAGDRNHIPARAVADVQTTGTGDAFMVSYLADRAAGMGPLDAARRASEIVADILEERRTGELSAENQ